MFRPLTICAVLLVAASAGCFGDAKDGGSSPTTGTKAPGANQSVNLTVSILNHTTQGKVGGKINVTWQITLPTSVNQTFNTTHTHVHWGNASVPDANMGNYTNESAVLSGPVPGTYNTSFIVGKAGDVYFRAHAELNGRSYWSDEVKMNVTAGTPTPGTTHEITIGATRVGPAAEYTPSPKTDIKVGDAVKWKNVDKFPQAPYNVHTATSNTGAAAAFNTGNIAKDATSAPIIFAKAGTYAYHCANHEATMTGTLTVT